MAVTSFKIQRYGTIIEVMSTQQPDQPGEKTQVKGIPNPTLFSQIFKWSHNVSFLLIAI